MASDIWIVTVYFNPCHYVSKKLNFEFFLSRLDTATSNLLVVEMAFDDCQFELNDGVNVMRVRGNGIMWQKERLLNIAISQLPKSCSKVVWLDCDLLFDEDDWLEQTSIALDQFAVVQPFSTFVRLPRDHREYRGEDTIAESFAAVYARDPDSASRDVYAIHGHTGFAWAAHREMLDQCGLYDVCLTASGDHLMAHAFAGTLDSPCIPAMIGSGRKYDAHFRRWAEKVDGLVDGRLGCVEGRVLHLWHGEEADRRYRQRNQEFKTFDFDPGRDIRQDQNGLWQWGEASQAMRDWASDIFRSRNEDGPMTGLGQAE